MFLKPLFASRSNETILTLHDLLQNDAYYKEIVCLVKFQIEGADQQIRHHVIYEG